MKTKTSHSNKKGDIGDALVNFMARQCGIQKNEFENLVECTLSQEEYEDKLRSDNKVP